MSLDVCVLFAEIRTIFREGLANRGECSPSLQSRIEELLDTLVRVNSSSDNIIASILSLAPETDRLKQFVLDKLLSKASLDEIQQRY